MKEIANGVFHIRLRLVNVYLCVTDEGLILIDTGMPGDASSILEAINAKGYTAEDIKHIFITHADIDHAGGLAKIAAASHAVVHAGKITKRHLQSGIPPKHSPAIYHWFYQKYFRWQPVSDISTFADGEIHFGLKVIATPGHTHGHHSFIHSASDVVFVGDAFRTKENRIDQMPTIVTADRNAAKKSVQTLIDLSPSVFACGHGKPLFQP